MTFTRVDDLKSGFARRFEDLLGRLNCLEQQRRIVAERGAETARVNEVPLHIDDDKRDVGGLEREFIRFGRNNGHGPLL